MGTVITPTETTPAEEVNNTELTPTGEVKEPDKKIPDTVPYKTFADRNRDYRDLQGKYAQLEQEMNTMKPIVESYQQSVQFYEDNPDFTEEIRNTWTQRQQRLEEEKSADNLGEKSFVTTEQFEDFKKIGETEKIKQRIMNELNEAVTITKAQNLPITDAEILEVMDVEGINKPLVALELLKGRKLDQIRQQWGVTQTQQQSQLPPGTPSVGGVKGALQTKRPSSFDEAVDMIKKSGLQFVK